MDAPDNPKLCSIHHKIRPTVLWGKLLLQLKLNALNEFRPYSLLPPPGQVDITSISSSGPSNAQAILVKSLVHGTAPLQAFLIPTERRAEI
jgi:hypothetical protein